MSSLVGLHPEQLLDVAIVPALEMLRLDSTSARVLVLGTALAESRLRYLRQNGGGSALGLYQVEPKTHKDLYANYLYYRRAFADRLAALRVSETIEDSELSWNLRYAAAVCRLIYYRVPAPLPEADDAAAMARYHKVYYNTVEGKAHAKENDRHFIEAFAAVVA